MLCVMRAVIRREYCRLSVSSSSFLSSEISSQESHSQLSRPVFAHCKSNSQLTRSLHCCSTLSQKMPVPGYTIEERGTENTTSYQVFVKDQAGQPISPFHDIPLVANQANQTFHVVIEVPRWTNAKMEIDTASPLHPIIQDTKKGKLRYVANSYPYKGYIWNYGCFPQTWENPNFTDENTGAKGDNDPVDICELGTELLREEMFWK